MNFNNNLGAVFYRRCFSIGYQPIWIQISFKRNLFLGCQIVLEFRTEHGNITVVDTALLCATFEIYVTDKLDFATYV